MSLRIVLILGCLLSMTAATITPKKLPDIILNKFDILQLNLTDIFEYTGQPTCEIKGAATASYFTSSDSIATSPLSSYAFKKSPQIVQTLHNSAVAAIFDSSKVLIQHVGVDLVSFGPANLLSFTHHNGQATCSEMLFNKEKNSLYIACFTRLETSVDNVNTVSILELNLDSGEQTQIVTKELQSSKEFQYFVPRMRFVPLKTGTSEESALIVYDQGTNTKESSNRWIWLLTGLKDDKLKDEGVIKINEDLSLVTIYDFFAAPGGILVTGKNSTLPGDVIRMAFCRIAVDAGNTTKIACDSALVAATSVHACLA